MPELPEVETIRLGLKNLTGGKIRKISLSNKKLRINSTINLKNLEELQINNIDRRARYLIIDTSDKKSLVIHLGMSGKLVLSDNYIAKKHDHFVAEFYGDNFLVFNDTRRFGFVDLIETKDLKKHSYLAKLGPEPLSNDFNFEYLSQKLQNKKMNIKTTMMDNEIVVGVGNIYINESLFDSAISPLRAASSLKKDEIKKLINSIKEILKNAIDLGGSSISDYVNSNGEMGNFQNNFKIYGRGGLKCQNKHFDCNNLIERIKQNGRSSFYCSKCQK